MLIFNKNRHLSIVLWSLTLLFLGYILFNLLGLLCLRNKRISISCTTVAAWVVDQQPCNKLLLLNKNEQPIYTSFCLAPLFFLNDFSVLNVFYFIAGIYLIFVTGFWLAYKYLPIENVNLKYAASIVFGAALGIEALYLSGFWIKELGTWTPLSLGVSLVFLFLVTCSILSKSFRKGVWVFAVTLLESFFAAVEITVKLKIGPESNFLVDIAYIVFYLLFTTSVGSLLHACASTPDTFQCIVFAWASFEVGFLFYHTRGKEVYSTDLYLEHCFNMVIKIGLLVALFWGFDIFLAVIFFAIVLWSYLESYIKFGSKLELYVKSYQTVLPKIEALSAFSRFRVKYINLAVYFFPTFVTEYMRFLTFGFGTATTAKLWLFFIEAVDPSQPFVTLGKQTFAHTTVLYTGLYVFVFSFLYVLWFQIKLLNNPHKRETSTLAWLLDLAGKESVFAIIGNPGSAAQNAARRHCIIYFYSAGALAGGTLLVGGGTLAYNYGRHYCVSTTFKDSCDFYSKQLGRSLTMEEMGQIWNQKEASFGQPAKLKVPVVDSALVNKAKSTATAKSEFLYKDYKEAMNNVKEFVGGVTGSSSSSNTSSNLPPKPPQSPKS